jgi:hypothetical protein
LQYRGKGKGGRKRERGGFMKRKNEQDKEMVDAVLMVSLCRS